MKHCRLLPLLLNATFISLNFFTLAEAQVIPSRLSSTVVNVNQDSDNINYLIDGGRVSGSNLFHFFDQFNLNSDQQAIFRNGRNVETIFSIVSGGLSSSINGSISAAGKTNLSFFNPNGISFGQNARLNIGGDFLASTANRLFFSDGRSLAIENSTQLMSALNPSSGNLVKLQFIGTSGGIIVRGIGHDLEQQTPLDSVTGVGNIDSGLSVLPGQSLSLLANGIELSGGIIVAPSATVSLRSIAQGEIPIDELDSSHNISFSEEDSSTVYASVELNDSALIDTSGVSSSLVSIRAKNLEILDNSFIFNRFSGNGSGGTLHFDISEDFLIDATRFDTSLTQAANPINVVSGVISEAISGRGTDIEVKAANLTLLQGGAIFSSARNFALGGNSNFDIQEDVLIQGDSLIDPLSNSSLIRTASFDSASAGSIELSANNLFVRDSGVISAINLSTNRDGPVNIDITDTTQVDGLSPTSSIGSFIISSSFGSGTSADINLNTKRLNVFDGGVIASSTFNFGSGGNLNVNVQDNLVISGFRIDPFDGTRFDSAIVSSASALPEFLADPLNFPSPPSGDAGMVNINSPTIYLDNFGTVTAFNQGSGSGGDVFIQSDTLISNNGRVTATAANESGGNIDLNINGPLIISNTSQFSASSLGIGTGGNIDLNSNVLLISNSSVSANALQGAGGNISISTQGFFPDQNSEITATSAFGIDGNIAINQLQNNIRTKSSESPKIQSANITLSCSRLSEPVSASSFTLPGSGSLPKQPATLLSQVPLTDAKQSSEEITLSAPSYLDPVTGKTIPIVEAQGLVQESDGTFGFSVRANRSGRNAGESISSSCLRKALKG